MQPSVALRAITPTLNLSPLLVQTAAKKELAKRRSARTDLIDFTTYTMPGYRIGWHHRRLVEKLEAVECGEIKRLIVCMPPRHGKSELVSKRFPAWYLGRNPAKQFVSASYGANLAGNFGRDVRNIVASNEYQAVFPGVTLATDSKAKDEWHTNKGGHYLAVGVGGALTGHGSHVLNIDDPVKDRQDADSEVVRDTVWDWYRSTAYTRLMPGGAIVITATRWHEDDLIGRLLADQDDGGDQWDVLTLPALSPNYDALWPEAYDAQALAEIQAAIGPRDWSALYQQSPTSLEGSLFKTAMIGVLPAAPAGRHIARAWDLAATKDVGTRDPDWTVGVKLMRTGEDRYVVLDVVRFRGDPESVERAIVNTADQDGASVRVGLPQDPGQAGKAQVAYLTRALAGHRVESSPETGDKSTRAAPMASQCNVGNLSIVAGPWNRSFIEELSGFPNANKDDQVDALSRAFSMVGLGRGPMRINPEALSAFRR